MTPDDLAPPTLAHRIEFRVCWVMGSIFLAVADWLMKDRKRHG